MLLGSVVFVDSLSPVASGGVVSTGVLVSVEGVVVLSGVCVEEDSVPVVVLVDGVVVVFSSDLSVLSSDLPPSSLVV